jgi:hypothetical protein
MTEVCKEVDDDQLHGTVFLEQLRVVQPVNKLPTIKEQKWFSFCKICIPNVTALILQIQKNE